MDKAIITLQEENNDGQSIYLYYDPMAGVYLAFGLSAYYTTMVTEPLTSYSEEMQMPVVLLNRVNILYLRQSLVKTSHKQKDYYQFRLRTPLGSAGYDKWVRNVLKKRDSV